MAFTEFFNMLITIFTFVAVVYALLSIVFWYLELRLYFWIAIVGVAANVLTIVKITQVLNSTF